MQTPISLCICVPAAQPPNETGSAPAPCCTLDLNHRKPAVSVRPAAPGSCSTTSSPSPTRAGITRRSFPDDTSRKVWLQHVLDTLVASKQSGGPLVGVMFWQAALR